MEFQPEKSPSVGDKYQAELPSLMSKFDYLRLQSNSYDGERSSTSLKFGIGLPFPKIWMNDNVKKEKDGKLIKAVPSGSTWVNVTDLRTCENSNTTNIEVHKEKNKWECHYLGSKSDTWSEIEEASFILGLYIFGKKPDQVKTFVGNKTMGDILAFYYGKFYMSDRYWRWYECKKNKKNRLWNFGTNIFKGQNKNEFLSRMRANVPEECYSKLLKVSKMFEADKISLKQYVSTVKTLVGLNILVKVVGIGTERDLTGFHARPEAANKIIHNPGDDFILTKDQAKNLFWAAVWPRLAAKGWHFKLHRNNNYAVASGKFPIFFTPEVKFFSSKLVKGSDYFDSIIDILKIVASNTKLIELETADYIGEANGYPKPPAPNFTPEMRMLTDGVMKAYAFEDGSDNNNTSSKTKESDFVDAMCLDKRKTNGINGIPSSNVRENNPSKKVLPKNQETGRRDAKKLKSIQNIMADGKNIVAVPPTPKKQKRLSGPNCTEGNFNNASLSTVPRKKQKVASFGANNSEPIENVTAKSIVAPKVNQRKRSNSLLPPKFGENTVRKGTPLKTVAESQSITNSIIEGEVALATGSSGTKDQHEKSLPRIMIDLNLPALPDDDPCVAAISKAVNHSENQPEMNTRRRSTRTSIPSKRMLAFWETKDL